MQWQAYKQNNSCYSNTLVIAKNKDRLQIFEYIFECLYKTYVFVTLATIIWALFYLELNVYQIVKINAEWRELATNVKAAM